MGVTGTNGKTSVCYMIEKILSDFGWKTGVMGTVDHHVESHIWSSELTTPDPVTLSKRLQQMKAVGARAVVMEVSSHALAQYRASGLAFDVGVFTNLTRDHLDYHASMEEYFKAKEMLFTQLLANSHKGPRAAVINMDDPWGGQIRTAGGVKWVGYGQNAYHLQLSLQKMDFSGTRFHIKIHQEEFDGFIPVPGDYSVYNACAAIGAAMHAGVSVQSCLKSLESFKGVPGRLERVPTDLNLYAFVDYAHTDDALRSVLGVLQDIRRFSKQPHKIHVVFGCGGDRDRGKRPLMMQAALEGADRIFVTSDNPRNEEPSAIISDIIRDLPAAILESKVCIEVDRRTAIHRAMREADPGDVILVAGKGHEDYQIIGNEKIDFSDRDVIQEYKL
ncbi:MAG: UDP-N-acetylmuramoyl-L-alanyl-D-glutamate--2,6-diaminopimelate ligase [Bdellovibrionales bacterium]